MKPPVAVQRKSKTRFEIVQRYGAEGTGPSLYIADPEGNTVELKAPPGAAG